MGPLVAAVVFLLRAGLSSALAQSRPPCTATGMGGDTAVCRGIHLSSLPPQLPANFTKLLIDSSPSRILHRGVFNNYTRLRELHLVSFKDLEFIQPGAFDGMDDLRTLWIRDFRKLKTIERGVFGPFHRLTTLRIKMSGLIRVPDFSLFSTSSTEHHGSMYEIVLTNNKIRSVHMGAFRNIKSWLVDLHGNSIQRIENLAFNGSQISLLDFENNLALTELAENAFLGIKDLKSLNLSRTSISGLPTAGLLQLEDLNVERTPHLKQFPPVIKFSSITTARLTYPHHCCAFQRSDHERWMRRLQEFEKQVARDCASSSTPKAPSTPSPSPHSSLGSSVRLPPGMSDMGGMGPDDHYAQGPHDPSSSSDQGSFLGNGIFLPAPVDPDNSSKVTSCGSVIYEKPPLVCTPEPNAFNPCEDVMGYQWLRVIVWFVVLAALLGNLVVILVLLTGKSKMTVPKFLMVNLSFADLLMGLYLLLIASVDLHSLGHYFTHAVSWQNDGGCQVAGFLTVFSSELSIFVLTVITLERWYAISYAIHLTKRLKLRQASGLMVLGWLYALSMATMPLLGISSYGAVSICLPMEVENNVDKGYVLSILMFNGVAFLIICGCYISMYFKVRNSDSTARSNDATIAKRMALLVFTNFVCWAPIAFFGLTASAGLPLIDITHSKILLVFFYPLNSCANPFLYVILTKQFRKDVFILLGRYGLCTERANRYKGTYTKSITNSRNNGLALHNVSQPLSDASMSAFFHQHAHHGARTRRSGTSTTASTTLESVSTLGRTLPVVMETGNVTADVTPAVSREFSRDSLYTSRDHERVRSASEYVILYPPTAREKEGRRSRQSDVSSGGGSGLGCSAPMSSTRGSDCGNPSVLSGNTESSYLSREDSNDQPAHADVTHPCADVTVERASEWRPMSEEEDAEVGDDDVEKDYDETENKHVTFAQQTSSFGTDATSHDCAEADVTVHDADDSRQDSKCDVMEMDATIDDARDSDPWLEVRDEGHFAPSSDGELEEEDPTQSLL